MSEQATHHEFRAPSAMQRAGLQYLGEASRERTTMVIAPFMARGYCTLLYGLPEVLKTTFALAGMVRPIVTGTLPSWAWPVADPVQQCPTISEPRKVLYITTENGAAMLLDTAERCGIPRDIAGDRIIVVTADATIGGCEQEVRDQFDMWAEVAKAEGVSAAFLDPAHEIHAAMDGDANGTGSVGKFLRGIVVPHLARAADLPVVLLHHTDKHGKNYAGSAQWFAASRIKISMGAGERLDGGTFRNTASLAGCSMLPRHPLDLLVTSPDGGTVEITGATSEQVEDMRPATTEPTRRIKPIHLKAATVIVDLIERDGPQPWSELTGAVELALNVSPGTAKGYTSEAKRHLQLIGSDAAEGGKLWGLP